MEPSRQTTTGAADVAGKVIWITGASRGLGRAIAVALGRAGAHLAVTARTRTPLDALATELAADLTSAGGSVLVAEGQVNDSERMAAIADAVVARHGRLDVLVNMAGINPTVARSEQLSDPAWSEVVDVNLAGTFYCSREAGRHMLAAGRGSVINVSSVHGSTGVARMAAYAASKGGVENLTRALALEWAERGVRVNCLAPGYFRTDLTEAYLNGPRGAQVLAAIPMGRFGEPDELVGAVRFLASDAASYVTGSTLFVDGGWTAH
ncbi:3-oxoacyl-ACP reductase family protein [Dactylosporangium sp. NPDC050688]|uniref:SDR family NAD(P)-dependent oxidoreductase n=1 Tax=Dactylosporangium sp. NPDC050688 TaxID=3157217 RepID=UPI003406C7C0